MEEEEKKKRHIDLDWDMLFPSRDDEPPPVLVVTTNISAPERKRSPPTMGDDQQEQSQRDELLRLTDTELNDAINRQRRTVETLGSRLHDRGAKLRTRLKRLEDEIQRRKFRRLEKDDDGCKKLTQSKGPYFISASDGIRQASPSSLPASQSVFTTHFCKKLEENIDGRTVNAFESEISYLGRCDRRKLKPSAEFSPKEQPKIALSSRQSPFQCPTNLSVDVDKHMHLNDVQNGGNCSTLSPHHFEEKLSGSLSKKNRKKASPLLPSDDLRPRNGKTVVLVDEEEPELTESMEQADKVDECMKECKIYYPSSDDPESIEIYYSDMECLAPKAYLSSTIMNFYIRYLQQPTSPTDRARCDYHFFNTYFYKKLKEAVLKKNDQENLFDKFRRWWKGVNIFHKAYILLPIHEDFLREEWKKYLNCGEAPPDLPIADRIWKNLPRRIEEKTIAVPQQRNDYDCGLFVLFFMERFIEEAPQRLKKKDLAMFGKKWFKPEEASNLRRKIRRLLVEEFRNATKENRVLDHEPLSSVGSEGERIVHPIDC